MKIKKSSLTPRTASGDGDKIAPAVHPNLKVKQWRQCLYVCYITQSNIGNRFGDGHTYTLIELLNKH